MNPKAGWYPDPSGRAWSRFWDGERWREWVDGTQDREDPLAERDLEPPGTDEHRLTVEAAHPPRPVPTPGAGWYRDPSGRHRSRYWDDSGWTAWVADEADPLIDPEGAPTEALGAEGWAPPEDRWPGTQDEQRRRSEANTGWLLVLLWIIGGGLTVVVALARAFNGLSSKPVWIGGFGLTGLATLIILFVYEARR